MKITDSNDLAEDNATAVSASQKAPETASARKKSKVSASSSSSKVSKSEKEPAHKKKKLTKAQKRHYIDMLMSLRKEFTDQIEFHRDDALSSKKDAAGERAGMATHMADLGTDNFRHDIELGLLSDEGDVVFMIDEALQRIENSEYGICLDCGCEINLERLDAKPYARYCTKCKSKREAMEGSFSKSR